jgi:hypothetical protein
VDEFGRINGECQTPVRQEKGRIKKGRIRQTDIIISSDLEVRKGYDPPC